MVSRSLSISTVFVTIVSIVSCYCPNGWIRYDDSCYRLYLNKQKWPEAKFECEKQDAYLALIETKQESMNIHKLMDQMYHGGRDNVWIGLTDVRRESTWLWEDTKQNATFFDWYSGEPNNNQDEDCTEMVALHGFQWNDKQCTTSNFFLCERPLQGAVLIG